MVVLGLLTWLLYLFAVVGMRLAGAVARLHFGVVRTRFDPGKGDIYVEIEYRSPAFSIVKRFSWRSNGEALLRLPIDMATAAVTWLRTAEYTEIRSREELEKLIDIARKQIEDAFSILRAIRATVDTALRKVEPLLRLRDAVKDVEKRLEEIATRLEPELKEVARRLRERRFFEIPEPWLRRREMKILPLQRAEIIVI